MDTPGLSAPDPRHRQVLTEFLPKADAILLVSDVNQQLTRSLANFCRDMKLANKSIYMVLTKCDSKTPDERKAARDYILAQRELGFADVVCVSGVTGEVDELMKVFKEISAKKQEILAKADTARLAQIKQELETTLEEQLAALESIENCKVALAERRAQVETAPAGHQPTDRKLRLGRRRYRTRHTSRLCDCHATAALQSGAAIGKQL